MRAARFLWPIVCVLLLMLAAALADGSHDDQGPLLIDAQSPVASPNRLFAPCPLTPRNVPNHKERIA